MPGLAKTLMVKALAGSFSWKFARMQFTPDLMPSDITGYELLGATARSNGAPAMVFRQGPVFANLVLADEINRAAPKTQSALLEAMAEQHVTVGGRTYPLEAAVPGRRHAESDRAGRDLSAARSAARSLHDGDPHRLSDARAGRGDRDADHGAGDRGCPRRRSIARRFCSFANWCGRCRCREASAASAVRLCRASRPGDRRAPHDSCNEYVSLGRGAARIAEPGAGGEGPALLDGPHGADGRRRRAVALPVLRHRIIPNHRAVGDSIGTPQIIERLLAENGR